LQNALENPDIAEDVKSYIRTILEKVGAVEKQRKATNKNKNKTQEVEGRAKVTEENTAVGL
jgi:hypothetical protein